MSQNPYPPTQPEPQQYAGGYQYPQYQPQGPAQQYPTYPHQQPVPAYGLPVVPQPNPYAPQALAPFGVDPLTGLPYSDKSKVAAGLLQIFLGNFGAGRFYLGNPGMAIAQLVLWWMALFLFWLIPPLFLALLWPLIDGIVLLAGRPRDRAGRPLRP